MAMTKIKPSVYEFVKEIFSKQIILWRRMIGRFSNNFVQYYNKQKIDVNDISNLLRGTYFKNAIIEKIDGGLSHIVFSLSIKNEKYYLRILPFSRKSVMPNVTAHKLVLKLGCKIPKIIEYKDNCSEINGRNYMILTEIKGKSIDESHEILSSAQKEEILYTAGCQLAKINSIPVTQYGKIVSNRNNDLIGYYPNYKEYSLYEFQYMLEELKLYGILSERVCENIYMFVEKNKELLEQKDACLAHGDIKLSHIYQYKGVFSGIIDFGEIKGASRYYDLEYFNGRNNLHHDLFKFILKGYQSIFRFPIGYLLRMKLESTLISVNKMYNLNKYFPNRFDFHDMAAYLKITDNYG